MTLKGFVLSATVLALLPFPALGAIPPVNRLFVLAEILKANLTKEKWRDVTTEVCREVTASIYEDLAYEEAAELGVEVWFDGNGPATQAYIRHGDHTLLIFIDARGCSAAIEYRQLLPPIAPILQ